MDKLKNWQKEQWERYRPGVRGSDAADGGGVRLAVRKDASVDPSVLVFSLPGHPVYSDPPYIPY